MLAELKDNQLVVRTQLGGPEEMFIIPDVTLTDGEPHLLHVSNFFSPFFVFTSCGKNYFIIHVFPEFPHNLLIFPSQQVKRINNDLEIYVDNEQVLNATLQHGGNLEAQVLYLGGVPDGSHTRAKRQLGVSNITVTVTRPHFKGTLQDIRVSNVLMKMDKD